MSDMIEQQSIIGGTPGGGLSTPKPTPGEIVTIGANPASEYTAATGNAFYGNFWRALRWAFDDLTEEFGDDLYERMLRDPQVLACVNVMKTGVLEDGILLRSCIDDKADPMCADAQEMTDLCTKVLDHLRPSLDDVLWDLLDGMALGCKVAEVTWYEYGQGPDASLPWIRTVKVKPRQSTAFVTDVYANVVGILARIPGVGTPVQAGSMLMSGTAPFNMLPREKFAVFTFRPKDNDPRGRTLLRAAYNAWWLKMQTWPQYLKFLVQFGTPSLIGYVGQNAVPQTLPGATQQSPEQVMVDALIDFQNGSAAAFPYGSKVDVVDVASGGVDAFVKAFDLYDRQITTAILHQTLATMEGQHQARAASETHMGVLLTMIRQSKRAVARMVRDDIIRPWVVAQFGRDAEALIPQVTLGRVDKDRIAELWNAAANLKRTGYLDASQFPGMDDLLGLPPRNADMMAMEPVDDPPTDPMDNLPGEQGDPMNAPPPDPMAPDAKEADGDSE